MIVQKISHCCESETSTIGIPGFGVCFTVQNAAEVPSSLEKRLIKIKLHSLESLPPPLPFG